MPLAQTGPTLKPCRTRTAPATHQADAEPSKNWRDLLHTRLPTWRPRARPARSPLSKWMPPSRRDRAASSAASENVRHVIVTGATGVTPGSIIELPGGNVTESPSRSLPVDAASTSAPAALKALCPDTYSAKGGVGI